MLKNFRGEFREMMEIFFYCQIQVIVVIGAEPIWGSAASILGEAIAPAHAGYGHDLITNL